MNLGLGGHTHSIYSNKEGMKTHQLAHLLFVTTSCPGSITGHSNPLSCSRRQEMGAIPSLEAGGERLHEHCPGYPSVCAGPAA